MTSTLYNQAEWIISFVCLQTKCITSVQSNWFHLLKLQCKVLVVAFTIYGTFLFQKWKCVKDKPAIKRAAQWKPAEDHYAGHQTPFVFVQWQFDRLLFFS